MIPHLDSSSVYHANTLPSIRTHFKDQQTRFQTCPNIKFQHQLHIVPMIEQLNPDKDRVIQQGLVLCTRTEQWYTRKKTTTRELQLRKTRLRWRRFKAVLKLDRLELYHVSKLIINTQRLAHIIYLDNQPPHRRVKLAMISTQDAVWSLEFMDRDTKCLIAYHFQSSHLSDAQAWYMSIYNLLPSTHYCKKPIPSYVDIHVLLEPNLLKEPLRIRLPLDYLTSLYEHFDIRTRDMKPILLSLLEKNEALSHINWKRKKLKLCWKHQTLNHSTEWVKEETSLISPSLIEKSHSLELHVLDQEEQDTKKSTTFDGLLIQKIYTNKKGKCKNVYYYSVLYGHHLFFFDGLYYFQCKKHDEKKKKDAKKQHWFSATTGFLFQQRKLTISKQSNHPNKRTQYKLGSVESSPHLKLSKPELIPPPDPSRLLNAKHVIDLHRVEYVEPCHQDKIFMLHINGTSLYYEAPNTQIMLEWVTLINNAFTLDRLLLYFNRDQHRQILLSGPLYVKHNYKHAFRLQYCILTKNEHKQGLLMFDTMKRSKIDILGCISSKDQMGQTERQELEMYQKKRVLIGLDNAFVYSGDECVLDQFVLPVQEPSRYYRDGVVEGGDNTSDCVFVIWQIAKRHIVPDFREYLSLLKRGHRLGNRGSCWVFKARSKQERDEWIWALHIEFGLLKL